jgi:hypothetical protein
MQERRAGTFTFTTEKDLIKFFRDALPRTVVSETIARVKLNFVPRKGATAEDASMQLLKKCEIELVQRAHEFAESQKSDASATP